jgi:NADPH2:quinone reductase
VVRIHLHGGPEVLVYEAAECGDPGPGQVRIRHEAIGLNYIDVYYRTGLYKAPNGLPLIPGSEGAGVVTAVGPDIEDLSVGDRVAYAMALGSYAEERLIAADRLVKVPGDIDPKFAAAMMLKGMTAEYLLHRTFAVKPGQTILFHASAGGVGLIAGKWAKHLGVTVIGTAGSPEKVALAEASRRLQEARASTSSTIPSARTR